MIVADDSIASQCQVKAVVEKHSQAYSGRIYLLDEHFRRKLCENLSPVHDTAVLKAINIQNNCMDCYGSARNTILLALAGQGINND